MTRMYVRWMLMGLVMTAPVAAFAEQKSIQEVLHATIDNNGVAAAVSQYKTLKENEPDAYSFVETELNALGYRLVREGKLAAATAMFELNAEAYPNSPNCYDSLGEAYLRAGHYDEATEMYEKSLGLLATADLGEQLEQQMENNARAKLSYLSAPDALKDSTAFVDFLANNETYPYGRLHPDAPAETEHWGRLAGEWDCTLDALVGGRWFNGATKATWIWKYVLDGFAVQDLWFVKWINLAPALAHVNRDVSGTNLRMYLPAEKRWEAVWFTNGANTTSRFDAISSEDEIVMTGTNAQGNPVRITFFDMTEDAFEWKSETSQDGGETWREVSRIHGRRVE